MITLTLQAISFAVPFGSVIWLWRGVRHWAIGLLAICVGVLVALLATGMFYGVEHFTSWGASDWRLTRKLTIAAGVTIAGILVLMLDLVARLKSKMSRRSSSGS